MTPFTNRRRLRVLLGVVAPTALLMAACSSAGDKTGGSGSPEDPLTVNLGTQAWIGYGPWAIAIEKGLDKANGIDIEQTPFNAAQDLVAAVSAGRLDGADAGIADFFAVLSSGSDAKVVMLHDSSTKADAVLAAPGIDSVAALKGKRVAFEERGIDQALLYKALGDHGLSPDDIKPVFMPSSDAGSALVAGRVDAAATYEPYVSVALNSGKGIKMIYSGADAPQLISDNLILTRKFVDDHPEAVRALIDTWDDAVQEYKADPRAGQAIIARALGSPVDALAPSFNGIEFHTRESSARALARGGTFWTNADNLMAILVAAGSLKGKVDYADNIDASFVSG